ncbi:MAG: polysaccharide deacetylase family protein [Pseudoflavonifractor sp.]|nr:polysaccharide deacetylase family protein [Pseudoflavonifractor sp.]
MTHLKKRAMALALALLCAFPLSACKDTPSSAESQVPESSVPSSVPTPEPEPTAPTVPLVPWGTNQVVEHLFFHPLVAYPELAFDGDSEANGIDDYMITVDEYNKILQHCYDNNYILVNMNDVWSEYTTESGETRMRRNTLMLPEGKKPLVISYDDVNYYPYMLDNGFTWKLILGDDGEIWSYGKDPQGQEVISQDLDAITILDKFVKEHPDFSLNGVKGCLSLTGYQGILGYRTQTDTDHPEAAFEANRQKEIAAVKPIVQKLKDTGWYFGSHTWGHVRLSTISDERLQRDTKRWFDEVGSLVGPTQILFYPHGARPDGDRDQGDPGPQFKYLQSQGFRIFASVGRNSYEQIKKQISAVIIDRLHPDGTTLRWRRKDYLQFYDTWDIIDLNVRPNRAYDRNPNGPK